MKGFNPKTSLGICVMFDPVLSFDENHEGYDKKIFVSPDGSPLNAIDGAERYSGLWKIGREAYALLNKKHNKKISRSSLHGYAEQILIVENQGKPIIQSLINSGHFVVKSDIDSPPILEVGEYTDSDDYIEGWLLEIQSKVWLGIATMDSKVLNGLPDYESLLYAECLLWMDDAIISLETGATDGLALSIVQSALYAAKHYRDTKNTIESAPTFRAKKTAEARHKNTNEQKTIAIKEWNQRSDEFSSMAAFARYRCKEYGVTERTLYNWISKRDKIK
ncbi:hypothetical protein QN382_03540 [Pseudomonas sp. 10B1]|uniref:hypothetical protein n=1 Tax=unclassified Pseudomonas TaxID=196821 RepID=UPI002B230E57|nr:MULTISPECIES: hypothetical protein [unclassified Pseudomonas]MEA9997192.1 hypothetical protein [Pseudomonas sp. AA4]MEB0088407.1 hypothetical protein [Pseudomonas sp. RTI1]MEB0128193.1 hypothetical protein [Pseudomonas sp. CCC1.2]MEB0155484.1 hypothetical protein [Pseudomonas sp. CCC4.3]MEB0181123.1 hypothetical protein [Pseudomonas sp. CCC3.2]